MWSNDEINPKYEEKKLPEAQQTQGIESFDLRIDLQGKAMIGHGSDKKLLNAW